jgi:osmotically-inducible protein OsmY
MSVDKSSGMLRSNLRSCLDRLTTIATDVVNCWIAQYSTADPYIAQAAAAALKWHAVVPADRVTVTVRRGWISLSGSVDWPHQKDAAGHALRHFTGVRGMTNDLHVQLPKSRTDVPNRAEVATRAAEREMNAA